MDADKVHERGQLMYSGGSSLPSAETLISGGKLVMDLGNHKPVLPVEVMHALRPRPGMMVVDCTLGLGGHARLLLQAIAPTGRLIGVDFDPDNLARAEAALAAVAGGRFALH